MTHIVRKKLLHKLLVVVFLFFGIGPAQGIVLHPDGEPNLLIWTDRPDSNTIGRWSNNASFVVIAPNWIATTRHQNTHPITVTIDGVAYTCHYKSEWTGGPAAQPPGNVDIQLVRLTTASGENPNLTHYAPPYSDTNELGKKTVIGGYGRSRGGWTQLKNGYTWTTEPNNSNIILRLGTNAVGGNDVVTGTYTSEVITAHFNSLNKNDPNDFECAIAGFDSGGGWFIKVGNTWKVAGLSRGVKRTGESWFLPADYIDSVRISSYAAWIDETTYVAADLTGDDWVDFADFAVFGQYWQDTDCHAPDWCAGADSEHDGDVDWNDLAFLSANWLTGWEY